MEKVKFDKVGSLSFAHNQDIIVGPLVERDTIMTIPPYYHGPFHTAKERWVATIDNRIALILSHNYCTPKREIYQYLILLMTKELVQNCDELDKPGPFYIKHDDDRYDHIRAEEDGKVTGILDWEWAYTTNKEEAFAAPNEFVPEEYHKGKNDVLSHREQAMIEAYTSRGRPDLAEYVGIGRKYHRLVDLLRENGISIRMVNALERAFLGLTDHQVNQPQSIEEWIEAKKEQYKDDEGLKFLLKKD